MGRVPAPHRPSAELVIAMLGALLNTAPAHAITTVLFSSSQDTNLVAGGTTSDTISTEGYLFTYTRDKLFSGGTAMTNGRPERVFWPAGLEAQAVTAGPTPGGARFILRRQAAELFAIPSFTAKLLGNTYGAGASIEIMPLVNGQDALADPLAYDATGSYGQNLSYTTPELAGYDTYKITLYVDFALMNLTLVDPSIPPPPMDVVPVAPGLIEISWSTNAFRYALECTTNLPATSWSAVTNNIVINGDLFTVQLDTSGLQRLFRLWK
jgi:hypothetical protein